MIAAWYRRQSRRDRLVLAVGAAFVAVVVAWAFVWQPLRAGTASLVAQKRAAEADLAWMREVAATLKQQRTQGVVAGSDRAGRSLLALADASAREAGLGDPLKRVEPLAEGRVNVWFENAGFDACVAWLEALGDRYGVAVEELSIDRAALPGMVNARITLVDAAATAAAPVAGR
ncbi:MAG TPA: type II secretion system protein M [Xanthomonadales bacterium]|nr:type II secretion system protein M [Xanthomonadales bacterium]